MGTPTNLWRDPRTGIYVWRRTNELTGKRFRRSTGTKIIRVALAKVQQFEEEYQREIAGLSKFEGYRRPLEGFVGPFLESLSANDHRKKSLERNLRRAFRLLRLDVLADLEDFIQIEKKLLGLKGKDGFTATTLVRGFQAPLKQFSRYLAGRREILSDHLAAWPVLKRDPPKKVRRALLPDEMARALAASDCLDRLWSRPSPMRPVWTALLVAAPRVSAFAALDVQDLDRAERRLMLRGNNIKRAGAANLDDATFTEIVDYVGDREGGPLFLSPKGEKLDTIGNVHRWRMCFSLAAVDLDWPENQPRDFRLEYLAHHTLFSGKLNVAMGGPLTGPCAPGPGKRAERAMLAAKVSALVERLRPAWEERTRDVDQHCLRMTHRTWALAAGVPEILIDRQLGHSSPGGEAALKAAWSVVGRKHYTDMGFLTMDAKRSAEAVRDVLGRAMKTLRHTISNGETALLERAGGKQRQARTGT